MRDTRGPKEELDGTVETPPYAGEPEISNFENEGGLCLNPISTPVTVTDLVTREKRDFVRVGSLFLPVYHDS